MEFKKLNKNKSVLNTDQINSLLWKLSIPVFFGMFVQSLYNVINAIFIGTMISQAIEKAKQAFTAAIVRPVLFLLPSAFLWTHFFKIKGVWLAFPSSDVLTFLLVTILMISIIKEFMSGASKANEIPDAAKLNR